MMQISVRDLYTQALPFWGCKICSKGSVGITSSEHHLTVIHQPTTTTTSTPNHENYSNFTDCLPQWLNVNTFFFHLGF